MINIEQEILIIEKAKTNPQAFEVLYNEYFEAIFRFIYQRTDTIDEAKDITQQVFVKAMSKIHNYTHKGYRFSSWLYRIAYNEFVDACRKQKVCQTVNIDKKAIRELYSDENSESNEELIEILYKVLDDLPQQELILIEMRFFEKRSFKEIADILSITESNAKVKTYRLLDKIREEIQKKGVCYES
ncbi:MAG: sigma-70 family RNA polymerase sigma factor [Marinilabiliales bacterium]|nr:MAG: sigma-70 family RNA polymerase sigma factor [Marinilabiliales bacterium]